MGKETVPETRGTMLSSKPNTPFTKGTSGGGSRNTRTVTSHSGSTAVTIPPWQQRMAPKLDAQIFPQVVEFHGAEPGTLYVLTLTIQNVSSLAKRIRIIPPESDDFTINYTPAGPVAPGLEVRAEVEFLAQEPGHDYHDQLIVLCDKQRIVVPLHAYAPKPDIIVSETLVDFGVVVLNNSASQKISVSNRGTKAGTFNIAFETATAPLTATPQTGSLRALKNPNDLYEESTETTVTLDNALVQGSTSWDGNQYTNAEQVHGSLQSAPQTANQETQIINKIKNNNSDERQDLAITNSLPIDIEFMAREVGPFHAVARVEVAGYPSRMVNIHALVVEQRVELHFPDSNKDVVHLTTDPEEGLRADFGSVYFGQKQLMKVAVVNNGPHSCTYQIRTQPSVGFDAYIVSPRDGGSDQGGSSNPSTSQSRVRQKQRGLQNGNCQIEEADLQIYGDMLPIRITPMEGLLGAYQEQLLDVVFYPKVLEVKRGFKTTQEKQEKLQFETHMQLICLETNQLIDLHVAGAAVGAEIELSTRSFKFGECPTNDRRDIVMTVTNQSDELPVEFNINRIAFFNVSPQSGRLLPSQKTDITVSFTPGQMGVFRNTLHMVVGQGITVIPLRVSGTCSSNGKPKSMPGGPDALVSNFRPKYKYVRNQTDPTRVIDDGVVVDDESKPKFVRQQAWEIVVKRELENPTTEEPDVFQVTADAQYTYNLEDLKRRQLHRDQYDGFLKNAIKSRKEQKEARKALRQGLVTRPGMEDSVDIGVEPKGGLQSPKLRAPKSHEGNGEDSVWLDRPLQGEDRNVTRRRRRPKVFNENKVIKRKFKSAPSNQAEVRDCGVKLSMDQLELISAGPKVLNFGTVCVNSKTTKTYSVCNDLSHEVFVEIQFDDHSELMASSPKSQVIPPGATAGFDVCFCSLSHSADGGASRVEAMNRIFRKTVQYTINGQHRMTFNIAAEVVPISVEMSTKALQFRFPEDNMEPSITEYITLSNTGNATAKFSFLTPAQVEAEAATHTDQLMTTSVHSLERKSAFSVDPPLDFIDPFSQTRVAVTFTPSQDYPHGEKLLFRVEGGEHQYLECTGQVDEPKCVFQEKRIEFGQVAVGLRQERTVTVKNIGSYPAVFWAESSSSSSTRAKRSEELPNNSQQGTRDPSDGGGKTVDGIKISPHCGRIPTGESVELTVTLEPHESREYQSTNLCASFRGGRMLRLPIVAEALVPKLRVVQQDFDFGGVTVGCHAIKTITLVNDSSVAAVTYIDLSEHPDISVSLLRDAGDVSKKDDDAESVMVPMSSTAYRKGVFPSATIDETPEDILVNRVSVTKTFETTLGLSGIQEECDEEDGDGDDTRQVATRTTKSQPKVNQITTSETQDEDEFGANLQQETSCSQYRISVGAKKTLLLNLTFTPSEEKEYTFELPMRLAGVDPASSDVFRKLVTGQGLKPRVHVSTSKVDFGQRVINTKNVKKLPYYKEVVLRNSDLGPVRWRIDSAALKNGPSGGVFGVDPTEGTLEHDESVATLRVSFLPEESGHLYDTLPIYLEDPVANANDTGSTSKCDTSNRKFKGKPYLEIALSGEGTYPKLTFNTSLVVLPPVPLGVKSRTTFFVHNEGYDNLELDIKLPPDTHRIPLSVSYPEGKILGMSKSKLPVQLNFVSRRAMSFMANIHLVDTDGTRFTIPVTGTAENCVLTNMVYINNFRNKLGFYRQAGTNKPIQLLHTSQISQLEGNDNESDVDSPPQGIDETSPSKPRQIPRDASVVSIASNTSMFQKGGAVDTFATAKESLIPTANVVAKAETMDTLIPEKSINFLVKWLNTTLLKSPIIEFPEDLVQTHGKPVVDLIESLMGKPTPGRGTRLSSNKREQSFQLLKQYTELINYLKENGALLHNVRPEHLLNKDSYIRVNLAAYTKGENGERSSGNGRDSIRGGGNPSNLFPPQVLQKRQELESSYSQVSKLAWATVLYQCVKILLLNRVTPKHVRALPGMENLTTPKEKMNGIVVASGTDTRRNSLNASSAAKRRGGDKQGRQFTNPSDSGVGPSGRSNNKQRRKKDTANKMFENLNGSNVYGASEELLLRWLAYHASRGHSIISKYNSMNTSGVSVSNGTTALGLPENEFLGISGLTNFDTDLQDGTVLCCAIVSHVPTTCGKGKPLSNVVFGDPSCGEQNVTQAMNTLKDLGLDFGVDPVEWANGGYNSWDCLLMVLYMFQQLPQYIPKATIEFDCTLGCVVTKALEIKNPSKRLVNYRVHLEGSADFKARNNVVRLDPRTSDSLVLDFCSRFSKPTFARLTLKPERTGGSTATTLVFLLKSVVTTRNAAQSIRCTTALYEPLNVQMEVTNPFDTDCDFKMTVFQNTVTTQPLLKGNKQQASNSKGRGQGRGRAAGGRRPNDTSKEESKRKLAKVQNILQEENEVVHVEPPFSCAIDSLPIRAKGTEILTVQFLPFQLGKFRCEIVFLDEQAGEFLYEIVGVTEVPGVLEKLEFRTEMKPLVSRAVGIPLRNALLDRATSATLAGSNFRGKRRTSTVVPRANRKQPDVPVQEAGAPPVLDTFLIEFSSPFFNAPNDVRMIATRPEVGNDVIESKSNSKLRLLNSDKKTDDIKSQVATKTELTNQFVFSLQPKAPGIYSSILAMYCVHTGEARLYEVEITVTAPPIHSELEFCTPARQSISQQIPITNNTDTDWTLQTTTQGESESFTGPRSLHVSANGGQGVYNLQFRPKWIGSYHGTLEVANPTTNETMSYEMIGVAEEPLAEDHVTIECKARDLVKHKFRVLNDSPSTITYHVESDMPHVSGESTVVVGPGPGAHADYELTINPLNGGTYTGSITFSQDDSNEMPYYWYTMELNVSSPFPEETLELETFVRKAVSLEITLANPLRDTVEFEVSLQGHGLLGDPVFVLGPEETACYELIYSPLLPGNQIGSISFVSSEVGEIWYELNLNAEPAEVVQLEAMECAIGSKTQRLVTLENPTGTEVELKTHISNRRNFAVAPSPVILKPYSSSEIAIEYTPSSLDREESARIELSHPKVGKWEFTGIGTGSQPSTMAPVTVVANLGTQMSSTFTFRNPFAEPLLVAVTMSSPVDEINLDARGLTNLVNNVQNNTSSTSTTSVGQTSQGSGRIFTLLLKRSQHTIPPFGTMQIPFAFAPKEMAEHTATVTVKANGNDLTWAFPLRGITEALPTDLVFEFQCKAREVISKVIQVPLDGVTSIVEDESFAYELTVQEEELQEVVMRSFLIKPIDSILRQEPAEFQVDFEPLRPFEAHLNLIVKRRNGGHWRHHILLEAKQADPDDTIMVHSAINSTSTVTFKLANTFPDSAPFKAYFTPDSSYEFTVFPLQGELEPVESAEGGTLFSVSFTPTEYGKKFTGRLVIDTEEMQWNYLVRGFHPTYEAPSASAKVSSHPRKSVLAALYRAQQPHHTQQGQASHR